VLHLEGAALVDEEEVGAQLGPLEPSFLAVLNQDDRPTTLFLGVGRVARHAAPPIATNWTPGARTWDAAA
jgi:hypothetical protein